MRPRGSHAHSLEEALQQGRQGGEFQSHPPSPSCSRNDSAQGPGRVPGTSHLHPGPTSWVQPTSPLVDPTVALRTFSFLASLTRPGLSFPRQSNMKRIDGQLDAMHQATLWRSRQVPSKLYDMSAIPPAQELAPGTQVFRFVASTAAVAAAGPAPRRSTHSRTTTRSRGSTRPAPRQRLVGNEFNLFISPPHVSGLTSPIGPGRTREVIVAPERFALDVTRPGARATDPPFSQLLSGISTTLFLSMCTLII